MASKVTLTILMRPTGPEMGNMNKSLRILYLENDVVAAEVVRKAISE